MHQKSYVKVIATNVFYFRKSKAKSKYSNTRVAKISKSFYIDKI